MNPYDFRTEEEKYIDRLLDDHDEGEHDRKVRDCPSCEVDEGYDGEDGLSLEGLLVATGLGLFLWMIIAVAIWRAS